MKTGTELENEVKRIADKLKVRGLLKLRKVDPPTFTTRQGPIHKTNPFLDFIGCTKDGTMVNIECKCHHTNRLPLLEKGKKGSGLTWNQRESILDWAQAGAIAGVLWFNGKGYYWITPVVIMEHVTQMQKSIPFTECEIMKCNADGDIDLLHVLTL